MQLNCEITHAKSTLKKVCAFVMLKSSLEADDYQIFLVFTKQFLILLFSRLWMVFLVVAKGSCGVLKWENFTSLLRR